MDGSDFSRRNEGILEALRKLSGSQDMGSVPEALPQGLDEPVGVDPNKEIVTAMQEQLMMRKQPEEPTVAPSMLAQATPAAARTPAQAAPTQELPMPMTQAAPAQFDPYGKDLNDEALAAAQRNLMDQQRAANLLRAGDTLTSAFTEGRIKADGFADNFERQGAQGVANIQQRREAKDRELARQQNLAAFGDETAMRDPQSEISKSVREGLKNLFPNLRLPDNVSAMMLKNTGINFGTLIAAKENADARRDMVAQRSEDRAAAKETKENDKIEKQIDNYSKRLEKTGITKAAQTLQEIDSMLQGGLDNTKGDIPGYGLAAGALPGVALSDKGQKLRQAVQRLANIELKDRSGAAVTDAEFQRFKEEFGTGTLKTEQQLLNGLRQYRNVLARVSKELEAATPRKALEEYESREGAVTSKLIPGADKVDKPVKKEATQPQASGVVKVRRKTDGAVKTLSAEAAKKYLNDPAFEEVK